MFKCSLDSAYEVPDVMISLENFPAEQLRLNRSRIRCGLTDVRCRDLVADVQGLALASALRYSALLSLHRRTLL